MTCGSDKLIIEIKIIFNTGINYFTSFNVSTIFSVIWVMAFEIG